MALVPSGPQQGSNFAQQGTIDWVSLGQTQFSASIAVLGRLSSAGVEPLTVAVGQAICANIPLGAHGEKVLAEEMSRLRACSSFGDVVWFGVGVRHILRLLVQTSQGASLVALCAGLSEGHNVSTSALIIHEMAKRFGGPLDLSPSFKQWEALVKVCSSVFSQSTLGPRIHQLLKLGGYSRAYSSERAGHPKDMAEVLLAVGSVARGALEEISISGGGPGCSWVAAFADQILGLKVAVRSDEGAMLWMNYDGSVDQGQISLQFCDRQSTEAISCVGRMFYVRDGYHFIEQCFQGLDLDLDRIHNTTMEGKSFLGGRIQWDSMLSETFGRDFEDLVNLPTPQHRSPPSLIHKKISPPDDVFAQLFIAGAAFFVFHTPEACRYRDITQFVLSAMSAIPELRPCKHRLLDPALHKIFSAMSVDELPCQYERIRVILARPYSIIDHEKPTRTFCLATITETILTMTYLFGRLTMESSLLPKRSGILRIYYDLPEPSGYGFSNGHEGSALRKILYREEWSRSLSGLFSTYVSIFSGESAQYPSWASMSAISDGKVYCFIDTLQGLSDSFVKASMIHVGAGSIQAGNRLHDRVYDRDEFRDSSAYQAQHVKLVAKNLCPFTADTTSTDLSIKAAVEESVRLMFWYHISSKLGATVISPGFFVQSLLSPAVAFKIRYSPKTRYSKYSKETVDHDQYCSVIHGEGLIPEDRYTRIILRPHHGNVLGRCVALMTSSTPVALLGCDSDFAQFMKFWDYEAYNASRPRYTLIS